MKNVLPILTILICFSGLAQVKVGGATLPEVQTFHGETISLNGAGIREKFWIDLYAAGLYLEEKTNDPEKILNAEKPMCIKLHIVSQLISSDKMIQAVTEGFENSTNGNTAPIQNKIDTLLGFFRDEIRRDDVFDLVYLPSKGVVAFKNGEEKGVIPGKEFKRALFGIWLSNRPADDDLKERLLAR